MEHVRLVSDIPRRRESSPASDTVGGNLVGKLPTRFVSPKSTSGSDGERDAAQGENDLERFAELEDRIDYEKLTPGYR